MHACSGIHSHNGTCRKCKAGESGCRLGRPQKLQEKTRLTQFDPVKDERGINTFKERENILSAPPSNSLIDISKEPIGQMDKRLLIWELKMRRIIVKRMLNQDGTRSKNLMFDNSNICHVFPRNIQESLDILSESQLDRLIIKLGKRNGLVMEYNKLITGLFSCNTNVSLLGSFSQAKSLLLYMLKYVKKAPDDLQAAIRILDHARLNMESYPSQAEDANTDTRCATRFLQGINNIMIGASEYSAAMSAFGILGNFPEFYSTNFWIVFVDVAIVFAKTMCPEVQRKTRVQNEHDYYQNTVFLDHDYDNNSTTDSEEERAQLETSETELLSSDDEFRELFNQFRSVDHPEGISAAGLMMKTKDGPTTG